MDESIFLVGFRAAGKTSVGKELAERMGWTFFDTDLVITDRTRCPIRTIVEHRGWQEFRRLEEQVLAELSQHRACIVATGGGAILHRERWRELHDRAFIVWLTATADTLVDRISHDSGTTEARPSLTGKEVLQEVEEILAEREPLYRETAHMIVDTNRYGRADIVSMIIGAYRRRQGEGVA